jgi:hypothetical protein
MSTDRGAEISTSVAGELDGTGVAFAFFGFGVTAFFGATDFLGALTLLGAAFGSAPFFAGVRFRTSFSGFPGFSSGIRSRSSKMRFTQTLSLTRQPATPRLTDLSRKLC